ncbi:MAG: PAS domain S-box protein, partial [Burkholderiales bacterium]
MLPPKPDNEAGRIAALHRYNILDTPPEAAFDDIARLIANVCETPIAVINFIAEDRQWFKSEIGLGVHETPLDTSICAYALLQDDLLIVPDLRKDSRFACNPLVRGGPEWRFYAGARLETEEGHALGTLYVLDSIPRELSERQKDALTILARQVIAQLELRRQWQISESAARGKESAFEREREIAARLRANDARLNLSLSAARMMVWDWDLETGVTAQSENAAAILGITDGAAAAFFDLVHPGDRERVKTATQKAIAGETPYEVEFRVIAPDGRVLWLLAKGELRRDETGRATHLAGVSLNISERKETEQTLAAAKTELTAQLDDMTRLHEMSVQLSTDTELKSVLDSVVKAVCRVHGAALGTLMLYDKEQKELYPAARLGFSDAYMDMVGRIAVGAGWCGMAVAERRRIVVENALNDDRFAPYRPAIELGGYQSAYSTPLLTHDGEVLGTIATYMQQPYCPSERAVRLTDLYARLASEAIARARYAAALRDSEARYRTLIEVSPQIVWVAQPDGHIIYCNESWFEYSGLTMADSGGDGWTQVIAPEHVARVSRTWMQAVASGEQFEAEVPFRRASDGQFRWHLARGLPLRDERGTIASWIGVAIDIDDRKQAEETLRRAHAQLEARVVERTAELSEANKFLQALLDNVQDAIVACDASGTLTLFNPATLSLHGLPPMPLPAAQWAEHYDLYRADGKTRMATEDIPLFRALRGERVRNVEMVIAPKRGPARTLLASGQAFHDDRGVKLGAVVSMHDISERKQAEQALQTAHHELERRATQLGTLTMQLTQAEAKERRRIAQMLHDDLQQMLLSGKFKLGALKNRAPDVDFSPVMEIFDQGIQISRSLTAELSPPALYQLDFAGSLAWLSQRIKAQYGLDLAVKVRGPDPALADELKALLFQALNELLVNVVKHAGADRASVDASTRWRGAWLVVRVEDDGAGFDATALRGNAGFGLFGIRERFEYLGGKVVVYSRVGRGTRVAIIVPISKARSDAESTERVPRPLGSVVRERSAPARSAIRVLVVDDHAMVRAGLRGILEDEPDMLVAGEAQDGLQAVMLTSELQPDVVLMDINMPKLDGVEATRRIKAAHS